MGSKKTVHKILLALIAIFLIGGTLLVIRQLNASVDSYSSAGKSSKSSGSGRGAAMDNQFHQNSAQSQLLVGYGLAGLSYGAALILGVVYFFLPKATEDSTTENQITTK